VARFELVCTECGRVLAEDPELLVCPECSRFQESGGSVRGLLAVRILDRPELPGPGRMADPETLAAVLPVASAASFALLPVGGGPLLPVPRLREAQGMPRLWVKDDTRNPSGSTKDRASLLVAARAMEYGRETIATASTGNAATALAAVCAASGQRAVVFVPESAPPAKLVQMRALGAVVLPVRGSYDQAFELCGRACQAFGWYNRNTAVNPFTTEGKKTLALEVGWQLAPEAPDVVVVPAGDGVITSGVAGGFADLVAWGHLAAVPRLLVVQPEGSSALVRALESGAADVTPVPGAASVADSLVVEVPRAARLALARVRASGGAGVTVGDGAIRAAIGRLASLTGVFPEPAAAAPLAGLERALELGLVEREERVVLLITGTGLKDPAAAESAMPPLESIEPDLAAVERRLAGLHRHP